MGNFKFVETSLQGLYVIQPLVFEDHRGYFLETYREKAFEDQGIYVKFVQDNESFSKKGVLRGLHFQTIYPQGKLVRVIQGTLFDVAVDLRKGSPTFGEWEGFILSDENKRQLYIPEGFAHGFLVLSDTALFSYKCTQLYKAEYESGIIWHDETLKIIWPLKGIKKVILSEKDKKLKQLSETNIPFIYKGGR